MSAFESAAKYILANGINNVVREMKGKKPKEIPNMFKPKYYKLLCVETHEYIADVGLAGVKSNYISGETYWTQDLSIHSIDRSKFKILGKRTKNEP